MSVYVVDTETSTTRFIDGVPDGRIVEIGVARVDMDRHKVYPCYSQIVVDEEADPAAWIFNRDDLTLADVMAGEDPEDVDRVLLHILADNEVTAYNIAFDRPMMAKSFPLTSDCIEWGDCLMCCASRIPSIPRRHADATRFPTALASYMALCPDDPCGLDGIEHHRALDDAMMEGHILLALAARGLYAERRCDYVGDMERGLRHRAVQDSRRQRGPGGHGSALRHRDLGGGEFGSQV